MNQKDACLFALDKAKLFESSGHRTRFKELMDCYSQFPFFTKGLCKCMYLSAWDEPHFFILLEVLTDLSLGKNTNMDDMRENGDLLADRQEDGEYYVYQLSNAFLDNTSFHLDESVKLESKFRYIIDRALAAAEVIDSVLSPETL